MRNAERVRTTVPLSDKQMETLQTALECGYFEVPRGITLKELAKELGCSHQATSERLRRANNRIVTALVRSDPVADTPKWATSSPRVCSWYHHDSSCRKLHSGDSSIKQISESAAEFHGLEPCPECIASRSLWVETDTGDN